VTNATRPLVAIAATNEHAGMLEEWTAAAGFDAVSLHSPKDGDGVRVCATLVRWPIDLPIQELPRPVILMYEPGAELQSVVGGVAEVMEVPDSKDVSSLLSWSANLGAMLWSLSARLDEEEITASLDTDEAAASATLVAPTVPEPVVPGPEPRSGDHCPRLIALGISTGGPVSLRVLFSGLTTGPQLPPIVIVQHIPPAFVGDLVQRLKDQTGYDIRFADDNTRLQPGVAYIAPGDHHVRVRACGDDMYVTWDDGPAIRGHCPSVDVLFESCERLEGHGVAVMMTGMGRDGAKPMLHLRQKGWATVGQDEATCTIYGMPGAAKAVGAVQRELPLEEIAPWLVSYCRVRQRA